MVRKTLWITDESGDKYNKPPSKYQYLDVKIFLPILILVVIAIIVGFIVMSQRKEKAMETAAPPASSMRTSQLAEHLTRELKEAGGTEAPDVRLQSFANWDGRVSRQEVIVASPTSLGQIQQIVRAVNALNQRGVALKEVRAIGGGYSYSDLYADEGQLMVDSNRLTTRVDGSPAVKLVTDSRGLARLRVLAGVTIGELVDAMVELQVQIPALPAIINAQVAGVIASGSHGGTSSMSEHVVGVTLVNGFGDRKEYNSEDHPEAMAALKCCVGMCGIYYDITFKVENLTYVQKTDHWAPTKDVMVPEVINAILSEGPFIGHWAPLTSWTSEDWETYNATGAIPENYDPINDLIWYQKKVAISPASSTRRRRRRSVDPLPALLGGRYARQAASTPAPDAPTAAPAAEPTTTPAAELTTAPAAEPTTAPAAEPTSMTEPAVEPTTAPVAEPTTAPAAEPTSMTEPAVEPSTEAVPEPTPEPERSAPPPPIDRSLMLHKMLYEIEYARTSADNNSEASLPEALASYNATGAMPIQEIGVTIADNTHLNHSARFLEIVFDSLLESVVVQKKMPILTMVSRWLYPATNCSLCPNQFEQTDGEQTLVYTLSFTTFASKSSYMPWLTQLFPKLSAHFPEMRVRWAYADSRVPGLLAHMESSLGQDLRRFKQTRAENQFDYHNRFLNSFVRRMNIGKDNEM